MITFFSFFKISEHELVLLHLEHVYAFNWTVISSSKFKFKSLQLTSEDNRHLSKI